MLFGEFHLIAYILKHQLMLMFKDQFVHQH